MSPSDVPLADAPSPDWEPKDHTWYLVRRCLRGMAIGSVIALTTVVGVAISTWNADVDPVLAGVVWGGFAVVSLILTLRSNIHG